VGVTTGWGEILQDDLILRCLRAAVHPLQRQHMKLNQEKVLELQDGVVDLPGQDGRLSNGHNLEDKEITTLCWASSNATLSSAERKLPIIILHWLPNSKSQNDYDGQLFVYGGGELGSEEVLTVLTLEWSARMKTLRCVGRAKLTLSGSFYDMQLLLSTRNNHGADLLVLTSPGNLQMFSHRVKLEDLLSMLGTFHSAVVFLGAVAGITGIRLIKSSAHEASTTAAVPKRKIVGIKSFLDAIRITGADVCFNAAQLDLVLLMNFKENMLSSYYCWYTVNTTPQG
ncbi:hypothetical protein Tco_0591082, partial [Tanacetum coccineum]